MRILVIQTAFLGDAILALPFLNRVLEQYPSARVDVVATGAGAEIIRLALARGLRAQAARVILWDYRKRDTHRGLRGFRRFLKDLKSHHPEPFAQAYCLQRSLRSALLAYFSGAPVRVGFSTGAPAFLYTHPRRRAWDTGLSEIQKNLELLEWDESHRPEVTWDPQKAPSLLSSLAPQLASPAKSEAPIVLSLGSPWPTKRWPIENAIPLVQHLTQEGYEVRLLGDAASRPLGEALKSAVPSLLLKDLSGQTSLPEWVAELEKARLVLTGDSAAVHAASDLGIPVLALFGPTHPLMGFAPRRPGSRALGLEMSCRPCHIHGPRTCPLGHHRCMKDLKAEQVLTHLKGMLDLAARTR